MQPGAGDLRLAATAVHFWRGSPHVCCGRIERIRVLSASSAFGYRRSFPPAPDADDRLWNLPHDPLRSYPKNLELVLTLSFDSQPICHRIPAYSCHPCATFSEGGDIHQLGIHLSGAQHGER